MAFMLYGFLFLFLSDIISLALRIAGVINGSNIMVFRKWSYILTLIISFILIAGGFINAIVPTVKSYNITINKSAGELKESQDCCSLGYSSWKYYQEEKH